jgi:transposase
MGLSRRRFTREFKLAAIQRLEQGISIAEVARALEVNPNLLHRWRSEFRQGPGNIFPGHGQRRWSEGRIAELERKIGQQTLEIDFLKGGACSARRWTDHATQVGAGPGESVQFLPLRSNRKAGARHMELRDAIQRIALVALPSKRLRSPSCLSLTTSSMWPLPSKLNTTGLIWLEICGRFCAY